MWAINPDDPTRARRPCVVILVQGERLALSAGTTTELDVRNLPHEVIKQGSNDANVARLPETTFFKHGHVFETNVGDVKPSLGKAVWRVLNPLRRTGEAVLAERLKEALAASLQERWEAKDKYLVVRREADGSRLYAYIEADHEENPGRVSYLADKCSVFIGLGARESAGILVAIDPRCELLSLQDDQKICRAQGIREPERFERGAAG